MGSGLSIAWRLVQYFSLLVGKNLYSIYSLQTVIDFSALYSLLPYSVAIVLMSYSIAYSEPIWISVVNLNIIL